MINNFKIRINLRRKRMRILKIVDGFITNSSSSGVVIILALQKGKSLREVIKKIGSPTNLPRYFYDFENFLKSEYFEDYEDLEVEHLMDEYDILVNTFTYESGNGEYYAIPEKEMKALNEILNKIYLYKGKDIIFLSEKSWP